MEIAEFLLARIAEDQHRADRAGREVPQQRSNGEVWGVWIGDKWYQSTAFAAHTAAYSPARVLAECEAKRRIVTEVHYRAGDGPRGEWLSDWQKDACEGCGWGGPCDDYHVEHVNQCPTLRLLALPYADHADYRDEWKP